jgi:DNA-binding MarR family transcriptional regulator
MSSGFKDLYQNFIKLAVTAEKLSDSPLLDAVEKRLLNLLSVYWSNKQQITVVEAMHMTDEISTSTIFRYLKRLRQKGYLELLVDEIDNRVKYIQPTKQTDKYFAKLGKLMIEASRK